MYCACKAGVSGSENVGLVRVLLLFLPEGLGDDCWRPGGWVWCLGLWVGAVLRCFAFAFWWEGLLSVVLVGGNVPDFGNVVRDPGRGAVNQV